MKESSMISPGSNKADEHFAELTLIKRHCQFRSLESENEIMIAMSEDKDIY